MKKKKTKFQTKSLEVIETLRQKLKTKRCYETLGAFYREIELIKFPELKTRKDANAQTRNVYSQVNYTPIVDLCVQLGWVTIVPANNRIYHVVVNQTRVKCMPYTQQ